MTKRQSIWVTTVFTLSLITITCLFIVIALQINTVNTMERQTEILTNISNSQQEIKSAVENTTISGTIPLVDDDDDEPDTKTSNDSTITVEELDTFVEDDDIVVEEKIVIHSESEVTERKVGDHITLPDIPTNTYRCEPYMVYDKLNDQWVDAFTVNSQHYKLQQECLTDDETGIRYYIDKNGKKWYCAALATAFNINIGSLFEFTLANGTVIPVIHADYKHDIRYIRADDYGDDDINYDKEKCINVIEFVVDIRVIPKNVAMAGTMSALEEYGGLYGHEGNIVDIVYCGRDTDFLNTGA